MTSLDDHKFDFFYGSSLFSPSFGILHCVRVCRCVIRTWMTVVNTFIPSMTLSRPNERESRSNSRLEGETERQCEGAVSLFHSAAVFCNSRLSSPVSFISPSAVSGVCCPCVQSSVTSCSSLRRSLDSSQTLCRQFEAEVFDLKRKKKQYEQAVRG